ncbi:hypothetical protein P245_20905 [Comamonas thiooxydans]|uniref:Uncharacterized protein n=1 Tax=Comamonas thiooxydans TaxID=363952 RepID=A0A0E3BBX6_9BURK|nr:hypothetical protein P245_20905 [Comamonas thiooxydans]
MMGFIEAMLMSLGILGGLWQLGVEIRKGLVEAAKVANKRGEDNAEDA